MLVEFGARRLGGKRPAAAGKRAAGARQGAHRRASPRRSRPCAASSMQPLPLGYCNVGVVDDGRAARRASRPATASSRTARTPKSSRCPPTCARASPTDVSDDTAAFTVLGAIGLQGIRLAAPTLGESFVVTGLGLIGLMTVQLLRANGCRVLGIDPDPARSRWRGASAPATVELGAARTRAAPPQRFTGGARRRRRADQLPRPRATSRSHRRHAMCRKRGRIVLVGVTGLELNRARLLREGAHASRCPAPTARGATTRSTRQGGHDYPVGFVRWTEQRNFEAVLDLMASGAARRRCR